MERVFNLNLPSKTALSLRLIADHYSISEEDVILAILNNLSSKVDSGTLLQSDKLEDDLAGDGIASSALRSRLLSAVALSSKASSESMAILENLKRGA